VVSGRLNAVDLANSQKLNTVGGKELPLSVAVSGLAASELRGGLRVGGATVVTADVLCTNGVIHVIDRVLIPAD
jgi:uncharacterized surface protein with fasciclin (FAS1) repeats